MGNHWWCRMVEYPLLVCRLLVERPAVTMQVHLPATRTVGSRGRSVCALWGQQYQQHIV